MMHTKESLGAELHRLRKGPPDGDVPPVLCGLAVHISGDPEDYIRRLRSVMSVAVHLGTTADFDEESVPEGDVPSRFAAAGSSGAEGVPVLTREYVFTREEGDRVIIQDHSAGHYYGEGGVGDQGPHLNVRPFENPRTCKVPGTAQHYEY
ncbi:HNH/endonuclease VII fold putative polymorphic toxin [Streptomyces sp. TRM70308]|uniref:HNH/endonuclease VII fold putative polymorphic toxin n=1 Tax=Streptomyces sp. TRM70308 TaxID=3131932 RepID=UPI003D04C366